MDGPQHHSPGRKGQNLKDVDKTVACEISSVLLFHPLLISYFCSLKSAATVQIFFIKKLPMNSLIDKYNIPGPRYTSYPTVPFWDEEAFTPEQWQNSVIRSFGESNDAEGISIYIHLPFCEQLCTF